MLQLHAKLLFCLRNNPNVGLVTVVNWVREGITWRKTIIDRKDRAIQLICPLSGVVLMRGRIHAHKTTTMEMHNRFGDRLGWFLNLLGLKVNVELKRTD